MKYLCIITIACITLISCSKENTSISDVTINNTITTSGHKFEPPILRCQVGDTVYFDLGSNHNAIEVSQENYELNISTPLNGGFQFEFGASGTFIPLETKTHYYVCTPHLPGMKAVIIVE